MSPEDTRLGTLLICLSWGIILVGLLSFLGFVGYWIVRLLAWIWNNAIHKTNT